MDRMNSEEQTVATDARPRRSRRFKTAVIATVGALVLTAGVGGTAIANALEQQRLEQELIAAYDQDVATATSLLNDIHDRNTLIPQATYRYVATVDEIETGHVADLDTVSKINTSLVDQKLIEQIAQARTGWMDRLADDAEDPLVTDDARAVLEAMDEHVAEHGVLPDVEAVSGTVTPPPASSNLDAVPTAEQVDQARVAVETNQRILAELDVTLAEMVTNIDALGEQIIEDGKLLAQISAEVIEKSEAYVKASSKASKDTASKRSDALDVLRVALDAHEGVTVESDDDPGEESDEAQPAPETEDSTEAVDAEETEATEVTVLELLTYVHEVPEQVVLVHELRQALMNTVTALGAERASHDAAVKKEKEAEARRAAEEAAAAGHSDYQDPYTGEWVPVWEAPGGGSDGGWTPAPPSSGGGGWTPAPAPAPGGGSGPPPPPAPFECPPQPPNTYWGGSTYTTGSGTCKIWVPYGDGGVDDW